MHVDLKEFTAFEVEGRYYIVRVATLYSQTVTEEEYTWLVPLEGHFQTEVTDEQFETLNRLRLVETKPRTKEERYAREKRIAEHALASIKPFSAIELIVAQSCNMRCTYCFAGEGEYRNASMMSSEIAFRAIDEMAKAYQNQDATYVKPSILFFGGEPLMNSRLILECADYCDRIFGKNAVDMGFTTNGILLTEELIDQLASHKISFSMSFDGPYQNVNRPLKDGRDSRAMILNRLAMVKRKYGFANVIATYYPNQDPAAIERDMQEVGGLHYQINPVSGSICLDRRADGIYEHDNHRSDQFTQLTQQALDAIHKHDEIVFVRTLDDNYFRSFFADACQSPAMPAQPNFCGVGRGMVTVTTDGEFYPCQCFIGQKRYCQGSLDTGYVRGQFEHCIVTERPECRECPVRYGCGGGCVATYATMNEAVVSKEPIFYISESFCELQRLKQHLHAYIYWSLDAKERYWALQRIKKC